MKKLIASILILVSTATTAQEFDQSFSNDFANQVNTAGLHLEKAASQWQTGLILNLTGTAVVLVGALSSNSGNGEDSAGLFYALGGAAILIGDICIISSWSNIKKAGQQMQNSPQSLSLKPTQHGIGLSYNF